MVEYDGDKVGMQGKDSNAEHAHNRTMTDGADAYLARS